MYETCSKTYLPFLNLKFEFFHRLIINRLSANVYDFRLHLVSFQTFKPSKVPNWTTREIIGNLIDQDQDLNHLTLEDSQNAVQNPRQDDGRYRILLKSTRYHKSKHKNSLCMKQKRRCKESRQLLIWEKFALDLGNSTVTGE